MGKLTSDERKLLELANQGELEVSMDHPVAKALDDKGLMKIGRSILKGGGILFSRAARITDAGRAALQQGAPDNG